MKLLTDVEWERLSPESRHNLNMRLAYPCEWHISDEDGSVWESTCGLLWVIIDGTPTENGMQYCPKCGKQLSERGEGAA